MNDPSEIGRANRLPAEVRRWAMWCHLALLAWIPGALLLLLYPAPLPAKLTVWTLLGVTVGLPAIAAVSIWLTKRRLHPFVNANGKEAINAWLTFLVYIAIGLLLWSLLLLAMCGVPRDQYRGTVGWSWEIAAFMLGVGYVLISGLMLFLQAIAIAVAAIEVSQGRMYRYARSLRFLR